MPPSPALDSSALDSSSPINERGKKLFVNHCSACHQLGGEGAFQVPPLDGSPWVAGSPQRLTRIVLHGLRGPIEIKGKTYNLEMPSFGHRLADIQIADLLSYVRQQFGNPSPPIGPEIVDGVRQATDGRERYWTVAELQQLALEE